MAERRMIPPPIRKYPVVRKRTRGRNIRRNIAYVFAFQSTEKTLPDSKDV
jgi:hypothetical protein